MITTYGLENEHLRLKMIDRGATILSLQVKVDERWVETTLAYEAIEEYQTNPYYLNCVVGPHAGRVKNGCYRIKDTEVLLDQNRSPHHIHGGTHGIHTLCFEVTQTDNALIFHCTDDRMEIAYRFVYELDGLQLIICYEARPKHPALINLTQHTYFNLGSEPTVADHRLTIPADRVHELDDDSIPTGRMLAVDGTVFDFRLGGLISDHLSQNHEQFATTFHVDHPFQTDKKALVLENEKHRLRLIIAADTRVTVVYLGNHLVGPARFKNYGMPVRHCGVAIEPQELPDGVNLGTCPNQIFNHERPFRRTIRYRFEILAKTTSISD